MTPLEKPISVCVVASGDWSSYSRVNCHEIAARWSLGSVSYLEPAPNRSPRLHDAARLARRAVGLFRGRKPRSACISVSKLQVVAPPYVPWKPIPIVRRWNVAVAARRLPPSVDVLWFFSAALAGLERQISHRLVIYHAVDDHTANPGVDRGLLEEREQALLRAAHVVFAASQPIAINLRSRHSNVVLWENVSDTEPLLGARTAVGNANAANGRPTAAYVGNLSAHKVDFPLMVDVARGMPDWDFIFAGPLDDITDAGSRLLNEPNVKYAGPIERRDLVKVIGAADVALLPLPQIALHESSFPMKLLDYFALGLPVVGRRTAPLARFADVLFDAASPNEYRSALEGARLLRRQNTFQRRLATLAAESSWSRRMADLENYVRVTLGNLSDYQDAKRAEVC